MSFVLFSFTMSRWVCVHVEEARGWRLFFCKGGLGGEGGRVVDGRRSTQFNKEHSKVRERKEERHSHPLSLIM